MARYIDADKLEYDLQQKHCGECNMYDGLKCKTCEIDDMFYYLTAAPTEDVVPKSDVDRLQSILDSYALQYGTVMDKHIIIERVRTEVARELFDEIEDVLNNIGYFDELDFEALKKKYTEEKKDE